MKKLLQGPSSDLSLGQNHPPALSSGEMEADPCVCRIKRKSTSTAPGKPGGTQEVGKERVDEGPLSWDGYIQTPRASLRQSPCDLEGVPELLTPEGFLQLQSSRFRTGWRQGSEEKERLCLPGGPPTYLSYRPPSRDCSADVIEYIVKELQGISRIQTEIAELQQHLTLIKGSVDEVSSCVDTVLSEIEGLQSGSGSASRSSTAPRARGSLPRPRGQEPVLYFYGIPEQERENTKELICNFLSKYHCFNGLQQSQPIKEASRSSVPADVPLAPRPAVVRLANDAQRDLILQKAILLQSVGVTVVAGDEPSRPSGQGPHPGGQGKPVPPPSRRLPSWDSETLQRDGVRTEAGGQFQLDSAQGQREKTSPEVHSGDEEWSIQQKPSLVEEGHWIPELNEPTRGVRQSSASPAWSPDVPPEQLEGPASKDRGQTSWASAGGLSVLDTEPASCEGGGRGLDAANPSRESSSLVEEEQAGGQTPGESETDCEATTTLEFLSPEPGSLLEEPPPVAGRMPGGDSAVCKLVGSSETLKDMIQIDLNEQDPTEQVFRDVLENSQYFLEHSRDSIDLVDMRFYTNKLGKALSHFRSALQVVFHKLETGDPEVLLEGEKSFPAAHEPAPALCSSNTHSNLENSAESPPSQSSESQANMTLSSDSVALAVVPRALPSGPLPLDAAPAPVLQPPLHPESGMQESVSSGQVEQDPGWAPPTQPNGCRPVSLEKVCAETIYLNKCINNFKNILREKRQMRRRLLKELTQEASWTTSADEMHSGTWLVFCFLVRAWL